jgi:hypothetical protein
MNRLIFLASIFLHAILVFALPASSMGQGKVDISLAGYKPPVVQGKTTELMAYGAFDQAFSLQSVEIIPPDSVSVSEIRENAPQTAVRGNGKRQRWSIFVSVDKNAQAGERQLLFVTPNGRSAPQAFLIASHVPVISSLKVQRAGSALRVTFLAADEAGDLSDLILSYVLYCGGSISSSVSTIKDYFKKNPKGGPVEVTLDDVAVGPGRWVSPGSCDSVTIEIEDRNGYSSKKLETKITSE